MLYHNDIGYCFRIGYLDSVHFLPSTVHILPVSMHTCSNIPNRFRVHSTSMVFIVDTFLFELPFLRESLQYSVNKSYIALPLIVTVHTC